MIFSVTINRGKEGEDQNGKEEKPRRMGMESGKGKKKKEGSRKRAAITCDNFMNLVTFKCPLEKDE